MPLNPAIVRAARETQATAYVPPPPAGPAPAWGVAIALGTPLLVAIIMLVALVRACRRPPAPPRPRLCPDCHGWGNDHINEQAKCTTCVGSGLAP
jgi:hypothetical protein